MTRIGGFVALMGVAVVLTACAPSGETGDGAPAASLGAGPADGAGTPAAASIVAESLARRLEILEDKLVSLAEAMPEDTYGWRPMDGVRSVGEVFAHAAGDNWFVLAVLGADVPAETGVTTDDVSVSDYERNTTAKSDVVAGLTASFTALRAALDRDRGQLDRDIVLRENSIPVGDLWIRAIMHLHEHLGQSIAYARSNGVAPPWSN